jgi:peptidylprolyl isomerase
MVSPMNSPHSPRRARRWITRGFFAATLALVPVLVSCGSSSQKAVDCSSKSSATNTSPEVMKPADIQTKSLDSVQVSGDFGSKPSVAFKTAFIGETEESIVVIPGTGDEIKAGQRVTTDYVATDGNDGCELDETYGKTPQNIILDQNSLLAPVYNAMVGQKVGARILVSADVTAEQGALILKKHAK